MGKYYMGNPCSEKGCDKTDYKSRVKKYEMHYPTHQEGISIEEEAYFCDWHVVEKLQTSNWIWIKVINYE